VHKSLSTMQIGRLISDHSSSQQCQVATHVRVRICKPCAVVQYSVRHNDTLLDINLSDSYVPAYAWVAVLHLTVGNKGFLAYCA